jgi:hypothetical protein
LSRWKHSGNIAILECLTLGTPCELRRRASIGNKM